MRICLIAKYPPIEGGVSSKAYWLARGLGERGHEVHVITNAREVEDAYREHIEAQDWDTVYQPKNVYVHNTDPFIEPKYIPYAKPYIAKLASLAIEVINEYDLQLIDSWYILPYVISGFLTKAITHKPQILRHAGSDITRLLESRYLKTLFLSVFKKVDRIVTNPRFRGQFVSLGIPASKLFFNTLDSVNTKVFNPKVEPIDLFKYTNRKIDDVPIVSYIGKIGKTKGVYELIEAASKIRKRFYLLFVSNGEGIEHFKKFIEKKGLQNKTLFIGFLPPWRIPAVIKRSTCIVMPERDFPVAQHMPILPREVMAVGKCLVLSRELYLKGYHHGMIDGKDIIVIEPKDITQFKRALERIIERPCYAEKIGKSALIISKRIESFDAYIDSTINLYRKVLRKK